MIGRKLNKYKEIRKNKSRYFLKKGRYENTLESIKVIWILNHILML